MDTRRTILVLGATGQTGRHFVDLALAQGYRVRALVRTPAKITATGPDLDVRQGDITDPPDLDELVNGVDDVVSMLGDVALQKQALVNTALVRELVPAMRRQGVDRLLYQAGGLSRPPDRALPPVLRALRLALGPGYSGQHRDNEAVMRYLVDQADDVAWIVHRAGIGSDGPSKGVLHRSPGRPSIGTFRDCAAYNLTVLGDPTAIHTCDTSTYRPTPAAA